MKKTLTMLVLMLPMMAFAQWRVGINGGGDLNHFIIDKQYQTDYQFKDRWGGTVGIMGQYDIADWAGIRFELDWMQKNYRQTRETLKVYDYKYVNNYLQLPVMGSFSFGGQKVRGFCNLGIYGGYWLNSSRKGFDYNALTQKGYDFTEKVEFYDDRDRRWDFGFVGGAGLEYRFASHWAAQVELRYYYSTVSTTKVNDVAKDYRYNSTLALQAGLWYCF
ncbi:MAG: PorT family protein [Prevotella sp.]|jgi:opacity protein-like surface antigen|nr:PorT family protein [Prevotella sp.]